MAEEPWSVRPGPPDAGGEVAEQVRRLRESDSLDALDRQLREVAAAYRRLHHLLDAVVAIGADLDSRVVLGRIVEAACDLVGARYGAIGVLGESGSMVDLIASGVDEEELLRAFGIPQGHGLLAATLTERKPLRVPDVSACPDAAGFPAGHPVMRTVLGVPLMVRGTLYGTIYLADKHDGTAFSDADEEILTALAGAAGVAVENARLYERLQRAAEHFQRRLLPTLPELGPLQVAAHYQPASELPRLGGDWYDAFVLPDGAVCTVIGDVTGHDIEAAPLMGQIRNMLRALAYDQVGPPSAVLARLDRALAMLDEPPTATLILGRVEDAGGYVFRWSNAGHPPPLLVGADARTRFLAPARHGIPMGVDPSVSRFDHRHPLPPGSTLLLFTDGLVERRGQDIDAGLRRLADQAARSAAATPEQLCRDLVAACGPVFDDDVAVLALRVPGRAAH